MSDVEQVPEESEFEIDDDGEQQQQQKQQQHQKQQTKYGRSNNNLNNIKRFKLKLKNYHNNSNNSCEIIKIRDSGAGVNAGDSCIIENNCESEPTAADGGSNCNGVAVIKKQSYYYYCLNLLIKIAFSTPGLVVLVIAYSIMGAFIFPLLEAPRELSNIASITKSREDCLRELWTITEKLNVLYEKNWTMLVHEQLRRFEGSIIAATRNGLNTIDLDSSTRWSFSEALLYSVTVITTIGHGNLTPKTSGGKIVTILYALIGVPLMLMCLSNLGGLLAEALQCTYSRICCSRKRRKKNQLEIQSEEDKQKLSCEGQSHEMDCNFCKYDAVSNETKFHHGDYDYTGVNEHEDSYHLIHNSPSKLNYHTTSPCMQVKSAAIHPHPIIKQYSSIKSASSSVETSPIKQQQQQQQQHQISQQSPQHYHQQQHNIIGLNHFQQHNQSHQLPQHHQYFPMTALNYRHPSSSTSPPPPPPPQLSSAISIQQQTIENTNMNATTCTSGNIIVSPIPDGDDINNRLHSTIKTTIYFPIFTSSETATTGNHFSNNCNSSANLHCNVGGVGGPQPIVKYHTISLQQQQQQQRQHQPHLHQLATLTTIPPTSNSTSSNKVMIVQQQQQQQQQNQSNYPHTATIHGIRRGKFIPKPMPQEINMLLAENTNIIGSGNSNMTTSSSTISACCRQQQQFQHDVCILNNENQQQQQQQQQKQQSTNNSNINDTILPPPPIVDIMEDEEENEQNRIGGCPHGTPSRIPLISSSSSLTANTASMALSKNHIDHHYAVNSINHLQNSRNLRQQPHYQQQQHQQQQQQQHHHHYHSHHSHHSHHRSHRQQIKNNKKKLIKIKNKENNCSIGNCSKHNNDNDDDDDDDNDDDDGDECLDNNSCTASQESSSHNQQQQQQQIQVPITIVLLILVGYICFGTVIFAFWENWSFIDGAYFCFVTLSTIGYGDFIPQKTFGYNLNYYDYDDNSIAIGDGNGNENHLIATSTNNNNHHSAGGGGGAGVGIGSGSIVGNAVGGGGVSKNTNNNTFFNLQLFACCAYLLLGLVLVAMSFSVLETQLMWKCRKIAVRLKLAKD